MRISLTRFLACGIAALAPALATLGGGSELPDQAIRDGLNISAFTLQELPPPAQPQQGFVTTLELGAQQHEIVFTPHSVFSPDAQVLIQNDLGQLTPVPYQSTTYRGFVVGNELAIVAASLVAGQLDAMIILGPAEDQSWFVQPLTSVLPDAPKTTHVVYSAADNAPGDWTCGVADIIDEHNLLQHFSRAPGGAPESPPLVCELAMDADFQFFQKNGSSIPNTTSDVQNVINFVSAIYEADANVQVVVANLIIRASLAANPYNTTSPQTLLQQFQSHWNTNQQAVNRDLAHLFTGVNLNGSVIGIAYLSVVCNKPSGYGLSESKFTTNMSFRMALTAHEIGHNFSANHCNQSPTICSPCRIMCSGLGGCSGISNFGCNAAGIANYAASKACLVPPPPPPPPLVSMPFLDEFPSTTLNTAKWHVNNGAVINSTATTKPSEPFALQLSSSNSVESVSIDVIPAFSEKVFISFFAQHKNVPAGKALKVEYFRPVLNSFATLDSVPSTGGLPFFSFREYTLPFDGFGTAGTRLRFSVGGAASETWFIDNVSVSKFCRADLNQDAKLDINDFIAFQLAFALGNKAAADYNNDGALNIDDFIAFQLAFALGCY